MYRANRRHVAVAMTVVAVVAVLAVSGCPRPPRDGPSQPQPTATIELEKQLNLFNWSQYLPEDLIRKFEAEFGVTVTEDYYSSNEEMLAKVETGATGYDLVVPGDYMVKILIDKGLVARLDRAAIPNLQNIDERFQDLPYDPGLQYSAPFTFGTNGIGVNTEKYAGEVRDWEVLFDPPQALHGRITMLNDMRMTIGAALKYSGFSFNSTDPDELARAKEVLLRQKSLLLAYDTDNVIQFLATGEAWMAYSYSGDVQQAAADNEAIQYVIPESGTVFWVDSYCILKRAPHPRAAAAFINFLLEPENHAAVANFLRYGCPNAAARAYIDQDILDDPTIFPPDDILDRCEFIEDVGNNIRLYEAVWNEVKAD